MRRRKRKNEQCGEEVKSKEMRKMRPYPCGLQDVYIVITHC